MTIYAARLIIDTEKESKDSSLIIDADKTQTVYNSVNRRNNACKGFRFYDSEMSSPSRLPKARPKDLIFGDILRMMMRSHLKPSSMSEQARQLYQNVLLITIPRIHGDTILKWLIGLILLQLIYIYGLQMETAYAPPNQFAYQ